MLCQSTSHLKVQHKIDKSNKEKRCNKKNPLLTKSSNGIPYNLRNIIRREINNNKHRQIKLLMPKGKANYHRQNQSSNSGLLENLPSQTQKDPPRQMAP